MGFSLQLKWSKEQKYTAFSGQTEKRREGNSLFTPLLGISKDAGICNDLAYIRN